MLCDCLVVKLISGYLMSIIDIVAILPLLKNTNQAACSGQAVCCCCFAIVNLGKISKWNVKKDCQPISCMIFKIFTVEFSKQYTCNIESNWKTYFFCSSHSWVYSIFWGFFLDFSFLTRKRLLLTNMLTAVRHDSDPPISADCIPRNFNFCSIAW